jgi:hypothetical protein
MDEVAQEFVRKFFQGVTVNGRSLVEEASFYVLAGTGTSVMFAKNNFDSGEVEIVFPEDWKIPDGPVV